MLRIYCEDNFRLILIFSSSLKTGVFFASFYNTVQTFGLQRRIIAGVKKSSVIFVISVAFTAVSSLERERIPLLYWRGQITILSRGILYSGETTKGSSSRFKALTDSSKMGAPLCFVHPSTAAANIFENFCHVALSSTF